MRSNILNASIYSKNGLAFSSLFFLICSLSNASDFNVEYSKLSTKKKTLFHECSEIHQAAKISFFRFYEYPDQTYHSNPMVNTWRDLETGMWNSDYGRQTGTVLSIHIDAKNRFGETTTKSKECGWSKGDYQMLFPTYMTNIDGKKTLQEKTER